MFLKDNVDLSTYLILIALFLLGCLIGGVIVYIYNAKHWHAQELEAVLQRIARTDSNMLLVNNNVKMVVSRFGRFADECERVLYNVDEGMKEMSPMVKTLYEKSFEEVPKEDEESATRKYEYLAGKINKVYFDTQMILERMKQQ